MKARREFFHKTFEFLLILNHEILIDYIYAFSEDCMFWQDTRNVFFLNFCSRKQCTGSEKGKPRRKRRNWFRSEELCWQSYKKKEGRKWREWKREGRERGKSSRIMEVPPCCRPILRRNSLRGADSATRRRRITVAPSRASLAARTEPSSHPDREHCKSASLGKLRLTWFCN